jgi:hypothetical protein
MRSFLPDCLDDAGDVALESVREILESMMVAIQIDGHYTPARAKLETARSRAELRAFLASAEAAPPGTESYLEGDSVAWLRALPRRSDVQADVEVLDGAALGSALAFRALARWIPTRSADQGLQDALCAWRDLLLDILSFDHDEWYAAAAPAELEDALDGLVEAVERAFSMDGAR